MEFATEVQQCPGHEAQLIPCCSKRLISSNRIRRRAKVFIQCHDYGMSRPLESFRIIRKNTAPSWSQDFYHFVLGLSWSKTFSLFGLVFVLVNLLFGGLYFLDPKALTNNDGSFWQCFFFSVQTMGTIGYGHLAPVSTYANILVVIEAAIGIVGVALMSGLFFAKFSLPRARLRFTRNILCTTFDGKPSLVFRLVNNRANRIIDAKVHFTLLMAHTTPEGVSMRRFVDLPLVRAHLPLLSMSMLIVHPLETGPLSQFTGAEMIEQGMEFFVTLMGTDGTMGQTIHGTHYYVASDIVCGGRFHDIVEIMPDGTRILDMAPFDQILPQ